MKSFFKQKQKRKSECHDLFVLHLDGSTLLVSSSGYRRSLVIYADSRLDNSPVSSPSPLHSFMSLAFIFQAGITSCTTARTDIRLLSEVSWSVSMWSSTFQSEIQVLLCLRTLLSSSNSLISRSFWHPVQLRSSCWGGTKMKTASSQKTRRKKRFSFWWLPTSVLRWQTFSHHSLPY